MPNSPGSLSNPIAALIQVPFQFNYDSNIGPNRDGDKFYANFQPVVPTQLNTDWNVISRTIVPIVSQSDIAPNSGSQTGVGDIFAERLLADQADSERADLASVRPSCCRAAPIRSCPSANGAPARRRSH